MRKKYLLRQIKIIEFVLNKMNKDDSDSEFNRITIEDYEAKLFELKKELLKIKK